MIRRHSRSGPQSYSRPGPHPGPLPRSFRFHYHETEYGIDHILDRQAAHGKPVDLAWLLNAREHRDSISVQNLELDSAQDLLLLVHYDQPHHPDTKGITVYPVQLSNAVIPDSHGMSIAHRLARKAAIAVKWGKGDWPDDGDSLVVEIYVCGDHFALFVHYADNQRVVICNWKTGQKTARIDSKEIHTDAIFPNAVRHPLDLNRFAWLAPRVFMIGCIVQHLGTPCQDSLYVYMLSENSQQPLSHSVMLELPRWKPNLRHLDRQIELVTGSWSEDIYPGALSRNVYRHVTVVEEECFLDKSRYRVYYVLRNDLLLRLLAQCNGRIMRWENWSKDCARALQGVPRNDPVQWIDVQICGQKVMIITGNRTQRTKRVVVADFDPGTFDTRMIPGTVEKQGATVAEGTASMFENGWVWTNLPYRSIPIPGNIDWDTKLILGADRIFYTRSGGWKKAGYVPVQAAYPQVPQGSGAVSYR